MKYPYMENVDNKKLATWLIRIITINLLISFMIYSYIAVCSIISRYYVAKEGRYYWTYNFTEIEDAKRIEEYNSFDK